MNITLNQVFEAIKNVDPAQAARIAAMNPHAREECLKTIRHAFMRASGVNTSTANKGVNNNVIRRQRELHNQEFHRQQMEFQHQMNLQNHHQMMGM